MRKVSGMKRNSCPEYSGIGVHNKTEQVSELKRNGCPDCSGICKEYQESGLNVKNSCANQAFAHQVFIIGRKKIQASGARETSGNFISRVVEEKIAILTEVKSGNIVDVCRKHNLSTGSFYNWMEEIQHKRIRSFKS